MADKSIGMSSRGDDEEQQMLIADLLHQEQHAVESLTKQPEKYRTLSKQIDRLRKLRQNAVKAWAGSKINPNFWCQTKHSIEASRRIQEIIENASRIHPDRIPDLLNIANDINRERQEAVNNFLSGDQPVESCERCEADLQSFEEFTKGLNSSSNTFNIRHKNTTKKSKLGGSLNMLSGNQLGLVNGGNFAGKGIVMAGDFVDEKLGHMGKPWYKRASTYIDVVGGLGMQIAAWKWIKNDDLQLVTSVAGSHMTTRVIDIAKASMTGSGYRVRPSQLLPLTRTVEQTPAAPGNKVAIF